MRNFEDTNFLALNMSKDLFMKLKAMPSKEVSEMIYDTFSEEVEFVLQCRGFSLSMECNLYQAAKLNCIFNFSDNLKSIKKSNFCDPEEFFLNHVDELLPDYKKSDLLDSHIVMKNYILPQLSKMNVEGLENSLIEWGLFNGDTFSLDLLLEFATAPRSLFFESLKAVKTESDSVKLAMKCNAYAEKILILDQVLSLSGSSSYVLSSILGDFLDDLSSEQGQKMLSEKFEKMFVEMRNNFVENRTDEQEEMLPLYENSYELSSKVGKLLLKNKLVDVLSSKDEVKDDDYNAGSDFKI